MPQLVIIIIVFIIIIMSVAAVCSVITPLAGDYAIVGLLSPRGDVAVAISHYIITR